MGGIRYVPILILTALLLFGCLGAPQAPPAGTTPSSGGATPSGGETTPPGGQTAPETPTQPEAPSQPTDDLAGLGYEALLALGQSLECDITTTDYQGNVMRMKVYMEGEDRVRSEFTAVTQTTCPLYISIFKDDITYMGCEGGEFFTGSTCDWLKIMPEDSEPGSASSAGFEQPVLDDVPPSNINCKLWAYNPAKFDTPGKACTMEELFQGYYPETYGYN
ncbi:MAG: hypothetical protein AB1295_00400 [Candidatus Micrarchaeota archaeon]